MDANRRPGERHARPEMASRRNMFSRASCRRCGLSAVLISVFLHSLGQQRKISLLEPKPRYCEIDACDHCQWGNDPRTAGPEPAKATRQKRGNQADNESADRSKSSPSVPIHFGREEIQDRIGNIPGTMRAQKDNGLRGINGKQRETASMCNSIEQRKSCSVSKDEPAIRQNGHYDPKPPILFMT